MLGLFRSQRWGLETFYYVFDFLRCLFVGSSSSEYGCFGIRNKGEQQESNATSYPPTLITPPLLSPAQTLNLAIALKRLASKSQVERICSIFHGLKHNMSIYDPSTSR